MTVTEQYVPTDWVQNGPPGINETRLEKIEQAIKDSFGHRVIGGLNIVGHSWSTGQGIAGRVASMLGVPEDSLVQLGTNGASLTGGDNGGSLNGIRHSSWGTVLQALLPQAMYSVNLQGAEVDRSTMLLFGINDPLNDWAFWSLLGVPAWKHALRTVISRAMACGVFRSNHSSVVKTTGFATTVTDNTRNSGPNYIRSTANGDKITITLPSDFPGGVVSLCWIGTPNGGASLNGALTNVATTVPLVAAGKLPASGVYVAQVDSEKMLVTGGQGTASLTVTRGVGGTTAASHLTNATVMVALDTYGVDYTGTVGMATGTTKLSGQGQSQTPVSVVKRLLCSANDAGKTIICTVSGIVAGDTGAQINFDSWWVEAAKPAPVMVCNAPRYKYGGIWSLNSIAATLDQNNATAAVVAEFPTNVAVVDLDAVFWATTGTLNGAINSSVTTISVNQQGGAFGTALTGHSIRIDSEDMFITSMSGTGPWSLTVTRGYNGTIAASHSNLAHVADRTLFGSDNVHPNNAGSARIAREIYRKTIETLLNISPDTISLAAPTWPRKRQLHSPGIVDGWWVVPPSLVRNGNPPADSQTAHPIYIPERCIITDVGLYVVTGVASTSFRFGLWSGTVSGGKPDDLLTELGTVATTANNTWAASTGQHYIVEPGWYWVGGANQGAGADPTVHCLVACFYQVPFVADPGMGGLNTRIEGIAAEPDIGGGFIGYYDSGNTGVITGALANFATPAFGAFAVTTVPRISIKVRAHHLL